MSIQESNKLPQKKNF